MLGAIARAGHSGLCCPAPLHPGGLPITHKSPLPVPSPGRGEIFLACCGAMRRSTPNWTRARRFLGVPAQSGNMWVMDSRRGLRPSNPNLMRSYARLLHPMPMRHGAFRSGERIGIGFVWCALGQGLAELRQGTHSLREGLGDGGEAPGVGAYRIRAATLGLAQQLHHASGHQPKPVRYRVVDRQRLAAEPKQQRQCQQRQRRHDIQI